MSDEGETCLGPSAVATHRLQDFQRFLTGTHTHTSLWRRGGDVMAEHSSVTTESDDSDVDKVVANLSAGEEFSVRGRELVEIPRELRV